MGVCSGPISAIVWGKRGRVAFPWAGQAYDRTDDISLQADSTPSHQSMAIHLKKFLYACRMLLRISLIPHFLVAVPFFSLLLRLEASTDSSKPHLVRTPTCRSRLARVFLQRCSDPPLADPDRVSYYKLFNHGTPLPSSGRGFLHLTSRRLIVSSTAKPPQSSSCPDPLPLLPSMSPYKVDSPAVSFEQDDHTSMAFAVNARSPIDAVDSPYSQSSDSLHSTSASSVEDVPMARPLRPGVYVPTVAFFQDDEDLDLVTIRTHAVRLAKAGVAGLATQGSNGEAVHLSHNERKLVTQTTRKALDDAGFHSLPVIVGCGAQSTRETIELCREAMASGGDYALILPPSYYKPMHKSDTILEYFHNVADSSPIPIMIYNYPGAVAGIDLSSDVINELSKHHNIVGCKLTCGNTGKLTRVAAATNAATPSNSGSGFMCMGGSADFTLQTLVVGGSGVICGIANVAPKACVKVVELYAKGKMAEAQKLQATVARGDWAAISSGIVGTKSALKTYFGYGGAARKPLPKPTRTEISKYAMDFKEIVETENTL